MFAATHESIYIRYEIDEVFSALYFGVVSALYLSNSFLFKDFTAAYSG